MGSKRCQGSESESFVSLVRYRESSSAGCSGAVATGRARCGLTPFRSAPAISDAADLAARYESLSGTVTFV